MCQQLFSCRAVSSLSTNIVTVKQSNVLLVLWKIERFSLDCRKTKTKVNTLANQRA